MFIIYSEGKIKGQNYHDVKEYKLANNNFKFIISFAIISQISCGIIHKNYILRGTPMSYDVKHTKLLNCFIYISYTFTKIITPLFITGENTASLCKKSQF